MKSILLIISALLFSTLTNAAQINISAMSEPVIDRLSYNYGRVLLNTSQYSRYTITNTGSTSLNFKKATIGGSFYSATHNCTGILEPSEVCEFQIRYSPIFEGLHSGRFILSFVEDYTVIVDLWAEAYRL